jgi:hypothetical protein
MLTLGIGMANWEVSSMGKLFAYIMSVPGLISIHKPGTVIDRNSIRDEAYRAPWFEPHSNHCLGCCSWMEHFGRFGLLFDSYWPAPITNLPAIGHTQPRNVVGSLLCQTCPGHSR